MENYTENVRCFLGQVSCPTTADPSSPNGVYTCRAWDGEKCTLLTLVEVFVDDFTKGRITTKYPESAPPPRIKS